MKIEENDVVVFRSSEDKPLIEQWQIAIVLQNEGLWSRVYTQSKHEIAVETRKLKVIQKDKTDSYFGDGD